MKIFGCWAAAFVLLYTMQTSLLPLISYNGVSPNLMLLFALSASLLRGPYAGIAFGFAAGLLQDMTSGNYFGCATFSYMSIGFLFGKFSAHVFKDRFFLPLVGSLAATALHCVIMLLFVFLLGHNLSPAVMLEKIFLPLIVFQALFAYPVHRVVYFVNDHTGGNKDADKKSG